MNQKTDNNSDLSKMNTTNYTNNDRNIDAEKLSKIAVRNRREQKEDYNSTKDDKIASTEDEFDFQSNDNEDLDENNVKMPQFTNQFPQSKFPMNISVLSISKAFKRDRRTYDEINSELIKSSKEELPKLANFILHQTDRIIRPIIGNKAIEENQVSTYNRGTLSFIPWRKDALKEMMANDTDLKNVENYLYNIYTSLEEYAKKKEYEKLINLLKYFETLAFDRDISNNLINTSFIQILIE